MRPASLILKPDDLHTREGIPYHVDDGARISTTTRPIFATVQPSEPALQADQCLAGHKARLVCLTHPPYAAYVGGLLETSKLPRITWTPRMNLSVSAMDRQNLASDALRPSPERMSSGEESHMWIVCDDCGMTMDLSTERSPDPASVDIRNGPEEEDEEALKSFRRLRASQVIRLPA